MQDVRANVINTPSILRSMEELPIQARLAIFGAGETGQEFARKLKVNRPDVEIVCFLDSFRNGLWENIPIREPAYITHKSVI